MRRRLLRRGSITSSAGDAGGVAMMIVATMRVLDKRYDESHHSS